MLITIPNWRPSSPSPPPPVTPSGPSPMFNQNPSGSFSASRTPNYIQLPSSMPSDDFQRSASPPPPAPKVSPPSRPITNDNHVPDDVSLMMGDKAMSSPILKTDSLSSAGDGSQNYQRPARPPPPAPRVSPPSHPLTDLGRSPRPASGAVGDRSQRDYEVPARSPPPAPRVSPPSRPMNRLEGSPPLAPAAAAADGFFVASY
ncbi:hypothetical protein CRG98_013626 [Punica granatum]|nr:hypothetical protein CRG98_013626 [Punica granatum]